jgi:hypothetical protein
VNNNKEKSSDDLLMDLVVSDIRLAETFAVIARSAYGLGRRADAESARLTTIRFYCEALRSVLQMPEGDRKLVSSDLQHLRTNIEWLSLRDVESSPSAESSEYTSMKVLSRILENENRLFYEETAGDSV